VGEDRRTGRGNGDPTTYPHRVQVGEAARILGISEGAVRMRVKRRTLDAEREGGRLYVVLHADPTDEPTPDPTDRTSELIATLQEQLRAERQAHAEARRIIAGLVERIPQLEAPQEAGQGREDAAQEPAGGGEGVEAGAASPAQERPVERRPWWRWVFGR